MKINIPIPPAIAKLPRDAQGYPLPFFAARIGDGQRTPAVADRRKAELCAKKRWCWICGQPIQSTVCFIAGPNACAAGRFSDGPMHPACAEFSVQVCPYMALSKVERLTERKEAAFAGRIEDPAHFDAAKPDRFGIQYAKGFRWERVTGDIHFLPMACERLVFYRDGRIITQ